jgi:hypothetical protein
LLWALIFGILALVGGIAWLAGWLPRKKKSWNSIAPWSLEPIDFVMLCVHTNSMNRKVIYYQTTEYALMTPRDEPFTPIVVTLVVGTCWALLMMLYVLFWSSDYNWLQNGAIILLSLVVMGCGVGLMWSHWIFRRA